ncbi:hypothetical protein GCM10009555_032880 [Acrocarpospora macrocephala]|uniref:Uncharacterized protein n=2 Tax=Acrocarpospora macrocephala TaxID=150177 RepID=A0A5M3WDR4_9ACTN|nr:hypothetical protein Amac_000640 [Acrocarpospora macrocephala]
MTAPPNRPTMTKAQALARVEQLIKEAADAIDMPKELELYEPSLGDDLCLDPIDGGSEERIVVNRKYFLRGIPKGRITEVTQRVKAHWEQQGHIIDGVSNDGLVVVGRTRPDDFYLALGWTNDDVPTLAATSTCIWPNGTPEPTQPGS